MLTNLWTQREEATACFIKKVRSFRIICYFILHFIVKIAQCFHLYLSRAAYTIIIRNHLTNSLHFHVVFYRLARIRRIVQVGKALIFLKNPIPFRRCMYVHRTKPSYKQLTFSCSVLQTRLHLSYLTNQESVFVKNTHLYFPRNILLKFEVAGNIIPKCIYC